MTDNRTPTRRELLAASSSVAVLGLAGCVGGDDDDSDDAADDDAGETAADEEHTVTLLVEGVGGGGHDHDHDDDHDDHHDDDHDDHDHDDDHHDDGHHDIAEEGLSGHDIDHACGHMEFDEPESLSGGSSSDGAPSISETHQPFAVNFEGGSGYVKFAADDDHGHDHDDHDDHDHDHGDGGTFAFFTEGEPVEVVTGHTVYEDDGPVDGCDDIGRYVVAEPDHGEVVLRLSAE